MYRYKINETINDDKNTDNYDYNDIKVLYDRIDTSTIPIVITEKEYPYRILYINEAWKELSGYSIQELYKQSIYYVRVPKIINSVIINKKKDGTLFEHEFEIIDIVSLKLKIGITKKIKKINLNQYHLLNKFIYNDLQKKYLC